MTIEKISRKCGFLGSLAVLGALSLFLLSVSVMAAPKLKVRIIQTNAAGDNLHIIDPETNKVVGVISGIEVGPALRWRRTVAPSMSATKGRALWMSLTPRL